MECNEIPVLSAKEVSLLISKRSFLPHKVCLSLKGCITAMSEKIRMKGDDMFLLEIDRCVFIIVKDYHLDWHAQLVPLETLVFFELRLTTIEKGVSKPQPILVAWKTSSISKAPHHENITCSTLKEWMSWMHLDDNGIDMDVTPLFDNSLARDTLSSFSGKVTKVAEADDGIFELNDSVRLMTGLNSSIKGDLYLHLGCNVHVYNAHKIKDATGQTTLVCCSCSLIKSNVDPVINLNMKTAEKSLRQQNSTFSLEDMKSTISKYRLNFREVETLLDLRDSLKDGKGRKEMKYLLHYIAKSFCHENVEEDNISVLDTFLLHEDFCPFVLSRFAQCRIPTHLTVAWLQEHEEEEDSDNLVGGNSSKWHYSRKKEWKDDKMLLGSIVVNGEGQTEFVDQSGRIPVVLIHHWSDQDAFQGVSSSSPDTDSEKLPRKLLFHQCTHLCRKDINPTEKFKCPFISPTFVGKMFHTSKFLLITEYFNNSNEDHESKQVRYLMFSLEDCVVLETIDSGFITDIKNNESFRFDGKKSQNDLNYIMNIDNMAACLIYVSGKLQRQYSEKHGKYFQLTGRILDPDLLIDDNVGNSDQKGKRDKLLKTYGVSVVTGDNICEMNERTLDEDNGKVLKRNFASVSHTSVDVFTKKRKSEELAAMNHVIEKQDALSKSTPITMNFNKGNTKLFPLIQPGHFYLLKLKESGKNSDAFKTVFLNENFGKAVKKCNAKVSIEVPEPVGVKDVFGSTSKRLKEAFDMDDKLTAVSVTRVLSEQFEDSLVSFTAIILRRQTKCSFIPLARKNAACSNLRDVQLDLCDLETYLHSNQSGFVDYISLYFEPCQMIYVLGLIPGTMIDVHCVERKVSKINKVYCRFIAVSSLHIISFLTQHVCSFENRLKMASWDFTQFPKEFIRTIWDHNPEDLSSLRRVWHIQCNICTIFSLKLQLSCQKCRGVFSNGCQSRGCDNTMSFDVVASCVILVEDGTYQAKVNVRKSNLVRKLLTLSDKQWDDVISLLQNTGQVYISKREDTSSLNQLETFLVELISSTLLIRPLKILVRVFKDSHCYKTVMNMKEEEFNLKDLRHGGFTYKVLYLPLFSLDCVDLEAG